MASSATAEAAPAEVRFHDEQTDTARINEILIDAEGRDFANASQRTGYIARKFIGTPYVAHTLEGDEELLTVNIDEVDCTTFVETAMAMSITAGERRTSWRDYLHNLQQLRYRNGEIDGYASRLHYICDWAVNNIHKGLLKDATIEMPRCNYVIRSIDFMSSNRDRYPALADSATFAKIKANEGGYRNHRFPYIKTIDLSTKDVKSALREGDAVALVSNMKNLDVTHMGFIVIENGEPYLLHASSSHGKVEISDKPLAEFMKKNRSLIGIRIFRLIE